MMVHNKDTIDLKSCCIHCTLEDCVFSLNSKDSIYFHPWGKICSYQVGLAFKYYCQNHYLKKIKLIDIANGVGLSARELEYRIEKDTMRKPIDCFDIITFEHILMLSYEHPKWNKTDLSKSVYWNRSSLWRNANRLLIPMKKVGKLKNKIDKKNLIVNSTYYYYPMFLNHSDTRYYKL